MNEILNPNCSEFVSRIGIKKSELPYIKKRIKDLGYTDGELLEEFTDYLDKSDDVSKLGSEMMSESIADDYRTIKSEVLAKRKNEICSFCHKEITDICEHIKEHHKEEAVWVYDNVTKEGIDKMRKEIVYNNL